ncbi:hypothetical protein [Cryptosporidium parvum Iowa II]|uniref:Uncharacterized protein n=2 Tax=Cryptosporidium parvum TaxID=5807 RepID=Q5CUJ3_CRYPI|nr:hypothetical protein [Cryptosporidium parvum Iowa II]EAK89061.1 hypothetical protein cgd3_2610 [Cryptosporidium parvum Iowa II]QOY42613.1 Uncharacterized protein CPATCC_0033610 [Cryptosporidium parvum]WKS77007.1 hypothetical protein CPCDC_3g2610 [Cryptosporidium sp. 43IA8]WRK31498.1 Uncharacterized protein cpbgf_3002610 [Cryptosporidium parvum]|eukprot:QOY42613.1 hypothetical protein CPATCC_001266 [Cryptosporidium parvum]
MDANNIVPENIKHIQQQSLNPTTTLNKKLIFSSNERNNLWDLFSSNFLLFKFYPSGNEIEEELKSIHEMIKVFENWKSLISTKKMSLFDFCKTIEKFTFHTETQDYRLRTVFNYKSIKSGMHSNMSNYEFRPISSKEHTDQRNIVGDQNDDSKSINSNQNLDTSCGIEEKLKAKRELALKRRKLLLTNKVL